MVSPDEGRLCYFACEVLCAYGATGELESLLDRPLEQRLFGSGRHRTRSVARAAALGEGLERYSATFLPLENLFYSDAGSLPGEVIEPTRFAFFHETQLADPEFAYSSFTSETCLRWTRAWELPGWTPTLVPAQLAFGAPSIFSLEPREIPLADITSNGLACAPTREEAILTALLELLERDAFMITWNNRLSLPLLDWTRDNEMCAIEERYFHSSSIEYSVVDLSVFHGIPTMLAVARGGPDDPSCLSLGAGAGITVRGAWEKALSEALGGRGFAKRTHPEDLKRAFAQNFCDIITFNDHIAYYSNPERAGATRFLDGSDERRDVRDVSGLEGATPSALVSVIATRLRERGIGTFVADVTAPDVRDGGLHVYRAISPELCPLDVGHSRRFLGVERLYTAPEELGLAASRPTVEELNHLPHPFP